MKMPELPVTTKSQKKCQFKCSYVWIILEIVVAVLVLVISLSNLPSDKADIYMHCNPQYSGSSNSFRCERDKSNYFCHMLLSLGCCVMVSAAFIQIIAEDRPLISLLFCCVGILTTVLLSCYSYYYYGNIPYVMFELLFIPVAFFVSVLQKCEASKSKKND